MPAYDPRQDITRSLMQNNPMGMGSSPNAGMPGGPPPMPSFMGAAPPPQAPPAPPIGGLGQGVSGAPPGLATAPGLSGMPPPGLGNVPGPVGGVPPGLPGWMPPGQQGMPDQSMGMPSYGRPGY